MPRRCILTAAERAGLLAIPESKEGVVAHSFRKLR